MHKLTKLPSADPESLDVSTEGLSGHAQVFIQVTLPS
jgi:hypothetical protein